MESRVNGSGVAGAEVQIDGATHLVITVPGNEDLDSLTRSAQMNIRPVADRRQRQPAISYPADYVPPATATDATHRRPGTDAETTGDRTAAIRLRRAPRQTTVPAIGDTAAPAPVGELARPACVPAAQALAAVEDTHRRDARGHRPARAATATAAATTAPADHAGHRRAHRHDRPATAGAAPAWPAGSDPNNPTQPLGTDQAAWDRLGGRRDRRPARR